MVFGRSMGARCGKNEWQGEAGSRQRNKKTENIARERKRQGKEELKRKCKKGERDTAGKEAKKKKKK